MIIVYHIMRELKENGFIKVEWQPGDNMTPDMHTKNVLKKLFDSYDSEIVS